MHRTHHWQPTCNQLNNLSRHSSQASSTAPATTECEKEHTDAPIPIGCASSMLILNPNCITTSTHQPPPPLHQLTTQTYLHSPYPTYHNHFNQLKGGFVKVSWVRLIDHTEDQWGLCGQFILHHSHRASSPTQTCGYFIWEDDCSSINLLTISFTCSTAFNKALFLTKLSFVCKGNHQRLNSLRKAFSNF
eukprot:GHVN01007564.1.p1 GENE.GHVN01007564.1~~GHVN01007564.1.p1  ORF type:complete len:190 (+),score=31.54 GHVN01007564.1:1067-1636(+)